MLLKKSQIKEVSFASLFDKNPLDYEFVSSVDTKNIPIARHNFDECPFEYHQPYVHGNSCSAHGTGAALSTLVGEEFNIMDFKEIWEQEVSKNNASPLWGGYTYKMIDAWREWWNKTYPNDKVSTIAIPMGDPIMYEVLKKGYRVAMGYKNHIGYNEDWMNDNLIDKNWYDDKDNEDWGASYDSGHCLSLAYSEKYAVKGSPYINIDNYKDNENRKKWNSNKYGVNEKYIKELVQRGIWHAYGYIFVFNNDIEVPIEQLIDRKLVLRLENRVVYNKDKDQFAIVKNGKAEVLKGKHMSELFKYKWTDNTSYVLGVDKNNWTKLGLR